MAEIHDRPDFKILAYEDMAKDWLLTRAFYDGVRQVREGIDEYGLPLLKKFEREGDDEYNARKAESGLYAVFQQAVNTDVGMVFQNSIMPTEVPEVLADLFHDIDMTGNDLDMFLRQLFQKADRVGHSFLFVDAPPPVDADNPTLADVAENRPWWVCYEANQVLNWRFRYENGKEVLEQVTIAEAQKVANGMYGEEAKTHYRVLRNIAGVVTFSVYEIKGEKGSQKMEVVVVDDQEDIVIQGFDYIPFFPMYGRKKGTFISTPPRLTLVDANKQHFNKVSLLDYILTFIKPLIVFNFDNKEDAKDFKMSEAAMSNAVKIFGESASVSFLELKGDSIPALQADITKTEERMAKLSFERFAPVRDNSLRTATEVGSDNRREMSDLAVMAKNLENTVDSAFDATIQYLQLIRSEGAVNIAEEERASLSLNIEYDKLTFSAEQMQMLSDWQDRGLLSKETLLELLPQFVDMPKGWSSNEELERLVNSGTVARRVLGATQVATLQNAIDNEPQA
jgi:hypothetical protein